MEIKDVSEKTRKEILEYIGGSASPWTAGGIAAFQIFDRQTGKKGSYPHGQAPCHNSVQHMSYEGIVVNAMKPAVSKKHKEFVLWVAQGSPYSYAVLNKDNEEQLLTRGMVIDVALCGRGGALWLCKAIRNLSEIPHVATVWKQLVDFGVDPLWAFVGGSILNAKGQPQSSTVHGGAFHYQKPKVLFDFVEILKKGEKNPTSNSALQHVTDRKTGYFEVVPNWGCLGYTTKRVPDGWGGYSEEKIPTNVGEYAQKIMQIAKEGKL